MLIFQFVGVEVFAVAYMVSALSHNWPLGITVATILLYLVFWMSDFYSVPPEVAFYYHVWNFVVIISAAWAGHIYSLAMKCRPLVRINYGDPTEKKITLPAAEVVIMLFVVGVEAFVAGINLWTLRTNIGLSPIGGDFETSGIALAVCVGILLIILSAILAVLDVRARLAVKYLWMMCWWLLPLLITDYGFYKYSWGEPGPEFAGAGLLIVSTLLNIPYAIWVPISKKTEGLDGEEHGIYFDPLYKNKNYAFAYIGGIGLTIIVAIMAFTFFGSWWNRSLMTTSVILIVTAGASMLASFLLLGFGGQTIEDLKNGEGFVEVEDTRNTDSKNSRPMLGTPLWDFSKPNPNTKR